MKSIGIDIGTTSICGVLVNVETGDLIKSITEESNAFILTTNEWEKIQDVQKIINIAEKVLEDLFCEDVVCIGITGQMHGIVYINKEGKHLSPLYIWQDGRGDLPYKNTTYAKYLNSYTGYGNVTNFYNKENDLVPKETNCYCTIYDYFAMKVCEKKEPIIHSSSAASFGLYDLETNKFSCEFNADITTSYTIVGNYKNVPVAVGIGDNQASFIGSVNDNQGVLFNVGTGSQVSVVSNEIVHIQNVEVRPFIDNKYLLVGASLCGGRSYELLANFYNDIIFKVTGQKPQKLYSIMDKMIEGFEKTNIIFNNRFCGTRGNPNLRGSITNIGIDNFTPNDFAAGILKGTANELLDTYKELNFQAKTLIGSGNGIRKSKYLQSIFEDELNIKMQIPKHKEEAAFGSALFALVSGGIKKDISEAQKIIKYE